MPEIKCPCQFKGTSFEFTVCPVCPANFQPKPEAETLEGRLKSIIEGQGIYASHADKRLRELLQAIKDAGYKSPEENFNEVMRAKKSGWDDCQKFYTGYVEPDKDQTPPTNPYTNINYCYVLKDRDPIYSTSQNKGYLSYGFAVGIDEMLTPHDNGDGTFRVFAAVNLTKEQLEKRKACSCG